MANSVLQVNNIVTVAILHKKILGHIQHSTGSTPTSFDMESDIFVFDK
jgi:hypothetical protein